MDFWPRVVAKRSVSGTERRLTTAFLLMSLLGASSASHAATYVVDSIDDSNLTACTAAANDCTLRGAINRANSSAGADTINFAIPGEGVQTILSPSVLPALTDSATTIDGYTQSGAKANTLATGTDAVLKIQIKGGGRNGLSISGDYCNVRGLSFTDCSFGLAITGNGNKITGNYLGLLADGTTAQGNTSGVDIKASGNVIGGSTPGERNVISGNSTAGVAIASLVSNEGTVPASANRIIGNYIGTDAAGTVALGNGDGVSISNAPSNTVGGVGGGEGNTISGNTKTGFRGDRGYRVRGNSIYNNGGLGIDLGGEGVANNDGEANGVQNYPVLTSAATGNGNTVVTGGLNSTANKAFTFDFYSSPTADSSGHGEGATYLGSTSGSTDASGHVDFTATFAGITVPSGAVISATATNSGGSTSEFSSDLTVVAEPTGANALIVTTTQDQVFTDGITSLREAVNYANSHSGPDTIKFNLYNDTGSPQVHLIQLGSSLILNDSGTTIDGYSQPGAKANTLRNGSNAKISMRLEGGGGSGNLFDGLLINGSNCTVRGLSLTDFSNGIHINGYMTSGTKVAGNNIGINAAGNTAVPNINGVFIDNSFSNIIGGSTPGERNTISGSTNAGVAIDGISAQMNKVIGNYMGTDPTNTSTFYNRYDVYMSRGFGNAIGGTKVGEGNLILNGVTIVGEDTIQNSVRGNLMPDSGIDLGGNGATANDLGDADRGPNNFQNFPVLSAASSGGSPTFIRGSLNSTANTTFTLDFYANGARSYLGSSTVTTDSSGNVTFSVTLPNVTVNNGSSVSATATDPSGNTSEFSPSIATKVAPVVSVDSPSVREGNSGTTALVFTFTLSPASTDPVSVSVNTSQGTAKSGSDYQSVPRGTVTFAPGQTKQTFTVQVIGDTVTEADEQFRLDVKSPMNATLGTASGTGTIVNDDLPTVSVNSPAVKEGNSGTTALTFTLTLSQASAKQVSVLVNTLQGTAKSGNDYVSVGRGTVTFAPGQTTQTFTVQVVGDALAESNEQFQLALRSPVNATLGTASGTGTILNDDSAPKSPSVFDSGSAPTS